MSKTFELLDQLEIGCISGFITHTPNSPNADRLLSNAMKPLALGKEANTGPASTAFKTISVPATSRLLGNRMLPPRPGGVIHLVTQVLDDSRLSPEDAVGFNLVFLNIYDHGQAYTEQEYRDWLAEAGFVDFERVPLPSNPKNSIITARKPTA